jgi:cysteine desulfuration protein SufE
MSSAANKLNSIIEQFAELEPRERLELLLEFAEGLPALPPRFQAERDRADHRVHECQTAVFLWVEVVDRRVQIYAEVAPEAPTVQGFVGILVDAFCGASPDEVLMSPPDLLQRLGLVESLGMVRMRGLQAIFTRIRREVALAAAVTVVPEPRIDSRPDV